MKFMLILHDNPEMLQGFATKPRSEVMAVIKEYMDWTKELKSRYIRGDKLKVDEPGRVLRHKNGKVEINNGPYSPQGEVTGGTMILEANDYAEACRFAETNPQLKYGGTIEVRQIEAM